MLFNLKCKQIILEIKLILTIPKIKIYPALIAENQIQTKWLFAKNADFISAISHLGKKVT